MKITKERLKELVKEVMTEESEYQTFFQKALDKAGKGINDMTDDEKKVFFNKIDTAWNGKGEKNEGNAFGAAVSNAKQNGDDEFEVGGEKYKVESISEGISIKDGKYRFYTKEPGMGYLEYDGKVISMGDYDFGARCFWMTHKDFKGQKALDTPKDVIAFFKKNKIVK